MPVRWPLPELVLPKQAMYLHRQAVAREIEV
jgi:hypothetical protein